MKKKLILTDDLVINAIMIADLKTKNVFCSENLNMTIRQYIDLCDLKTLFDEQDKLPQILNKTLTYAMDSSGITSKGYKYQASAYLYKGPDMTIAISVIEGVEDIVENLLITEMN